MGSTHGEGECGRLWASQTFDIDAAPRPDANVFMGEQGSLEGYAPGKPRQGSVAAHHPVTRQHQRQGIGAHRLADGANCGWPLQAPRQGALG